MKRFFLIGLVMLSTVFPLFAQAANAELITLNDVSPAIDVVITLPQDTTGTIALDFAQASVRLTDSTNAVVFYAADARLHGLELNIAPNSGTHTLTVERLPGATEAYVRVAALPEMTLGGLVTFIESDTVTLNQEAALTLNPDTPGATVNVNVPADDISAVTATFPGANATAQLVDEQGLLIAEAAGGHVDGVTFVLDGGAYNFTVLGSGLNGAVVAGVRAVSAAVGGFALLEAPSTTAQTLDTAPNTQTNTACVALITSSSVNLRSGPGTGYSVLNYAYRGETYTVGGKNPENNWLLVGKADGSSAWVSQSTVTVRGACDALAVFNIPLRDASPAQLVITTSGGSNDDDEYEDHDDDDDDDDDDDEDGDDD